MRVWLTVASGFATTLLANVALAKSTAPVRDLLDAVQRNKPADADHLIAPSGEFFASYEDEDAKRPVRLTFERLKLLAQSWTLKDMYSCQDDLAVVHWTKGGKDRYSRVWTEGGRAVKIVGDTAPLVCTSSGKVNG